MPYEGLPAAAAKEFERLDAAVASGSISASEYWRKFDALAVATFRPRISASLMGRRYDLNASRPFLVAPKPTAPPSE